MFWWLLWILHGQSRVSRNHKRLPTQKVFIKCNLLTNLKVFMFTSCKLNRVRYFIKILSAPFKNWESEFTYDIIWYIWWACFLRWGKLLVGSWKFDFYPRINDDSTVCLHSNGLWHEDTWCSSLSSLKTNIEAAPRQAGPRLLISMSSVILISILYKSVIAWGPGDMWGI